MPVCPVETGTSSDGATSMWGKPTEARRLIALRTAALGALSDQPPFSQKSA